MDIGLKGILGQFEETKKNLGAVFLNSPILHSNGNLIRNKVTISGFVKKMPWWKSKEKHQTLDRSTKWQEIISSLQEKGSLSVLRKAV